MATVSDLLAKKGKMIHSVSSEATVFDAVRLMSEKGVGAVLVMEDGRVRGVVSERDILRRCAIHGTFPKDARITEIMTKDVIFVKLDQTVENCMELMTHEKIRHLPVLEGERITGIVSIGDVVKSMLNEKDSMIKHYEKYIYEAY